MDNRLNNAKQLHQAKKFTEAEAVYLELSGEHPKNPEVLHYFGLLRHQQNRLDDAIQLLRSALKENPNYHAARYNLATIFFDTENFDQAKVEYLHAIEKGARHPLIHLNLSIIYEKEKNKDKELSELKTALKIDPNCVEALSSYAACLSKMILKTNEAIQLLKKSLTIRPNYAASISALPALANYSDDVTKEELFNYHVAAAQQLIKKIDNLIGYVKTTKTNKINIGFVSSDFRDHVVARFFIPILQNIDKSKFHITCYYHNDTNDDVTKTINALANRWRDIHTLQKEEVAKIITSDNIEILFDLNGFTAGSRLDVFAIKPAPIQVTYLGYPNTTGFNTVDYRLTDKYADPPGSDDQFYTEKLVRFSQCFVTYQPSDVDVKKAEQPPVVHSGFVTFGSFANAAKLSPTMLNLWFEILERVPSARLALKFFKDYDSTAKNFLKSQLLKRISSPDRIIFFRSAPDVKSHLEMYNHIDIALDSFPYHGTTTTCDAFWMGVPVVSLAGDRHCSRVGISLNANIGLPELTAYTKEQFVNICCDLANDTGRILDVRQRLNQNRPTSRIFDPKPLVADFEKFVVDAVQQHYASQETEVKSANQ